MAISSNFTLKNGLSIEEAYLKIDIVRGDKNTLGFSLVPYKEKNSSDPLEEGTYYEFRVNQDENSVRWDKQAYEYLKTLPEYASAIDVLE